MDAPKGSRGKREQRKLLLILAAILLCFVCLIGTGISILVSNHHKKQQEIEAQRLAKEAEEAEKKESITIEVPDEVEEMASEEDASNEIEEMDSVSDDEISVSGVSENEIAADAEEETFFAPPKDARALSWANEQLSQMSLEQKVAQLFVITPEALTGHGSVVGEAKEKTRNALKTYPVGGVIYYDKNIGSPKQVTALLGNTKKYVAEQSEVPIFLAIDEEGGQIARVANYRPMKATKVSDMATIGADGDTSVALDAGETIGSYLSELGFNLDFAPVADVLIATDNKVMQKRCFSEAPSLVWDMDEQFLKGLNNHAVAGCVKQFPGYAITSADPHKTEVKVDLPMSELEEYAFVPFKKAALSGAEMMMVGQVILTEVSSDGKPCCLSSDVVTGILRSKYQYDGVLITDTLNQGALSKLSPEQSAVDAISAGMDMLLTPKDFKKAYKAVLDAVKDETISESRIDESVRRILTMKYRYRVTE